jgi:signal transduction histidine kinase
LVAAVRGLGKGDYHYPVKVRGSDEVAEVTASFLRMRTGLRESQRKLIDAERLATIGRMASSISHDLRHSLAAIMANAEFLSESSRGPAERAELYQEVRLAVNQMTELIDSLLEFSRTREALHPAYGSLDDVVNRAVHVVSADPEFHGITIRVQSTGTTDGWFDARKMERVFQNLVRNACEAVSPEGGKINITLHGDEKNLVVMVEDNGRGIPELVRERLFEPFVSQGKENGTGLGLTIVQKLVVDHGGDVKVEHTSSDGTVFIITLPRSRGTPVSSPDGNAVVQPAVHHETHD